MGEEGVEATSGVEVPQGQEVIGQSQFDRLATILDNREKEGCNVVGWGGDNAALKAGVQSHELFPTSAFVIVAKGVEGYKREGGGAMMDDPNLMRDFAQALDGGAEVLPQAAEMSESEIRGQLENYFASRGIVFDSKINLQPFIQAQVKKIKDKANAWEEANR